MPGSRGCTELTPLLFIQNNSFFVGEGDGLGIQWSLSTSNLYSYPSFLCTRDAFLHQLIMHRHARGAQALKAACRAGKRYGLVRFEYDSMTGSTRGKEYSRACFRRVGRFAVASTRGTEYWRACFSRGQHGKYIPFTVQVYDECRICCYAIIMRLFHYD